MDRKVIVWDLNAQKGKRKSSSAKPSEFAQQVSYHDFPLVLLQLNVRALQRIRLIFTTSFQIVLCFASDSSHLDFSYTFSQVTPSVTMEGHTMKVTTIILKPGLILSAGRDCMVFGWNGDGSVRWKLSGHMGPVNCLGLMSPACVAGTTALVAEPSVSVRRQSESSQRSRRPSCRSQRNSTTSIPEETDIIVSCCGGGLIKCWSASGKQVLTKRIHESPIECLQTDSERHLTITGSWDNLVTIFNTVCKNTPNLL